MGRLGNGLFVGAVLTAAWAVMGQVSRFDRITVEDGLSQSVAKAVLQDHMGMVWIGTQGGLNRYDGYTMTHFLNEAGNPESLANNYIRCMYQDDRQRLWIGGTGGLDRYDFETGVFLHHQHDPNRDDTLSHNSLRGIQGGSDGTLWVATDNGLNQFDPETGRFIRFLHDSEDAQSLLSNRISCILSDGAGRLWVGSGKGLSLKTDTGFRHYVHDPADPRTLSGNGISSLAAGAGDVLWVGTTKGLNQLDLSTGRIKRFMHDPDDPDSLGLDRVYSLLEDEDGRLWVGLYGGGLDVYLPDEKKFVHHRHNPRDPTSLTNDMVEVITRDDSGAFWFGTFEGVSRFDPAMPGFGLFRHDADDPNSLSHDLILSTAVSGGTVWVGSFKGLNRWKPETRGFERFEEGMAGLENSLISSLTATPNGRLWVGAWGGGINYLDPGVDEFQSLIDTDKLKAGHYVSAMYAPKEDVVWVADWNSGVFCYSFDNDTFKYYSHDPNDAKSIAINRVRKIMHDGNGRLLMGTFGRGIDWFDSISGTFNHLPAQPDQPFGLSHGEIYDMFTASDGIFWVGTGGGLCRMVGRDRFRGYHTADGLPSDMVVGIGEDAEGRLWLSTLNGLSRFDPKSETFFNFDVDDGLQSNEFGPGAFSTDNNGTFYVGGVKGLNIFEPMNIHSDAYRPPVVLTDFRLANRTVPLQRKDKRSPLMHPIEMTDRLVLGHDLKMFSFDFAALHFTRPAKNRYAYKMEGFDTNWIQTDAAARRAVYTALPAGDYLFRVKGSNKDGVWNEDGARVRVTILPAPWLTWWAKALYLLCACALFGWYLSNQRRLLKHERHIADQQRQLAEQEHLRADDLRRLDKLKDEFLANTSHELRTPLNGIIGLAESLVDGARGELNGAARQDLQMIAASGKRLSGLVNDILDFSKLKNQNLELHCRPVDLHALVEVVIALTRPLVRGKDLELVDAVPRDLCAVHGDENRLQQILLNLVGNAVKFTESGRIEVRAKRDEQGIVRVDVLDTGIGIPKENHLSIFASFEQVDGSDHRGFGGTGLGLAVSKQLVELHGGSIWVESQPGEGSVFSFTLPSSKEKPQDPPASVPVSRPMPEPAVEIAVPAELPEEIGVSAAAVGDGRQFRILIVDDEPVNRRVLINHLSLRSYQVTEAPSGPSALQLLERENFDLVLLDVMMPGLSGYQVCETVRARHSFQELPVIFLTAKNQVSDLVAAFDAGGNDFLSKPVSKEELLSRVRTHLMLLDTNRTLEVKVAERTHELGEINRELETIDMIVRTMNSQLQFDKVLVELPEHGRQLFTTAINGCFLLWDPKGDAYRFTATTGVDLHSVEHMRFTRDELERRYIRQGHKVTDGIFLVQRFENETASDRLGPLSNAPTMLVMMIGREEAPNGFLVWDLAQGPESLSDADVRKLTRFREHAASAVARALFTQTLHQKNEEILRAQARLVMQEKMAGLGTLTSGIAHELQNPLNFVNNFSSVAREMVMELREELEHLSVDGDRRLDECVAMLAEIGKSTGLIYSHGQRAGKIIQKMMELTKVSRGAFVETDLNNLFHEFSELALQHQHKEHESLTVAVTRNYEQGVGRVMVDAQRLSRAVVNVTNNALDAVREKASSQEGYEGLIKLTTQHLGDVVELIIEDNGGGISTTLLDDVTTPFFTTKSADSGHVGLGLSVAYDVVVDEHGGSMDIESEEGGYTRVRMRIPLERG